MRGYFISKALGHPHAYEIMTAGTGTATGALMPNPNNINAPITLIAHGRSGTSLCMNVLRAHPDVTACGETGALLFGSYHATEMAAPNIRPHPQLGPLATPQDRAAHAVRLLFLDNFQSDRPRWVHKPINVPQALALAPRLNNLEGQLAWYWDTYHRCFPDSLTFSVLRHPYDVMLSSRDYWGLTPHRAWQNIVKMAQIIAAPGSDITFAVSYERLVNTPEAEVARMLDHLHLTPHRACIRATEQVYVPQPKTPDQPKAKAVERVERGFSRRHTWDQLDMSHIRNEDRDTLIAMWARFGETLEF